MKSFTLLALAAGASATGFNFKDFGSFSCPSNTDNQCTDKQRGGFSWDDLPTGGFSNYNGFSWKGWTCKDSFGKREAGRFAPRTGGKAISGVCGHDASSSPSFGCESGKDTDKFSIGEIHVKPEFGCDLEFHYDMPGGEKCKHRSSCSDKGSVVKNDQCGGATSVTIVYPSQTGKPKPTCSIEIPTISFSCGSASTTKPPKTTTTKPSQNQSTTSPAEVTTTSAEEVTTTSAAETTASETSPAETTPAESTTAAETTSSAVETTSAEAETTSSAVETTTSVEAETTSSPAATTSVIFANSTTSVEAETTSSPAAESTTSEEVYTSTTEFLSTSTIFSTVVSTVTSCAPTVTNCPAHSVHVTTVLVPVSTTICPVTETHTIKPSTTSTSPAGPTETLPCPTVVPKCLNTWIFSTGCSDNTDASCYCPDEIFVKNVFSCMYSYGETDTIISEAVIFFQGICAPYIPGNPAIATGAETVTTYITVAPTSVPSAVYTTVVVDQTTVVPCTNTAGETIPSSSSTVVLSTTLTVPQVGFTTAPSGGVGVIPVTSYTPVATSPAETVPVTGITTAAPVSSGVATGTGFFTPTPTPSQVVVSGGDKITGFGLAGLAVMALVAAL